MGVQIPPPLQLMSIAAILLKKNKDNLTKNTILKIIQERNIALEGLIEDKFAEALLQAIKCGDFQFSITEDQSMAGVSYVPYREVETWKRKYHELISAVESKYPDETRHETALRYIKDREFATITYNQPIITKRTLKYFKEITLNNWPAKR